MVVERKGSFLSQERVKGVYMIYKDNDLSLCVEQSGTEVSVYALRTNTFVSFRKGEDINKVKKGLRFLIKTLGKVPSPSLIKDILTDPVFTRSYKGVSYPMTVRNTGYSFLMGVFKKDPMGVFLLSYGGHSWRVQKDTEKKGILCTGNGYFVGAYFSKGRLTIVTYTGDPQAEDIRMLAECLADKSR